MSELDQLRDLSRVLAPPDFEDIAAILRRRRRRDRILSAAAAAATAVVLTLGALAAPGPSTRADLPPVDRSHAPTASPTLAPLVPSGQRTITPDIDPADIHGYDVLATVTTDQPAHRGASDLTAVVPDTRQFASTYCRGPSDLYYFIDIGDGSQGYDRCSPSAGTTLDPQYDIGDLVYQDPVQAPQTIRMWVARPSAAWVKCMHDGVGDCTIDEILPLGGTGAAFGFKVYALRPSLAFQLLDDTSNGGPYPLQALATRDGVGWLVDRAVVAAPGSDRLVVSLPPSDGPLLLDVYPGVGAHLERCRAQHDELPDPATTDSLVYAEAFDQACGTDLRLVVDGTIVRPVDDPSVDGHFQELGGVLPAGSAHEVLVEVARGDARNAAYAVVIRRRVPVS